MDAWIDGWIERKQKGREKEKELKGRRERERERREREREMTATKIERPIPFLSLFSSLYLYIQTNPLLLILSIRR